MAASGCLLVGYDAETAAFEPDSGDRWPEMKDAGGGEPAIEAGDARLIDGDANAPGSDAEGGRIDLDAALTDGARDGSSDGDAEFAHTDASPDADGGEDAGEDAEIGSDGATTSDADSADAGSPSDADAANAVDGSAEVDATGTCTQGPNACGGCAVLSEQLGASCGACGLGRFVCAGPDALRCEGGDALPAARGGFVRIDDFEDGDGHVGPGGDLSGEWFSVSDETLGVLEPPLGADLVPAYQGANGTSRSAHVAGTGFLLWGAGLAASLNAQDCSYDARAQLGVTFYAKGTGTGIMVFSVGTRQTVPVEQGGTCTRLCYDLFQVRVPLASQWRRYFVPWTALAQAGWGTPAPFAPSELRYIQFAFDQNISFDAYIDEVGFY